MSKIPSIITQNSMTLMLDGGTRPRSFSNTDPVFNEVLEIVKRGGTEDEVLAVVERAQRELAKASRKSPNVTIEHGVVKYKGTVIDNSLTQRMQWMMQEGFDLTPMALFLENMMENPSYRAVTELYSFLEKGKMPITPDGHFMAYKAVRADFKDIHSGTMDNSVGRVVEMPRNAVDDNKDRTCSTGLHFCSFDYLPHFANANGHIVLLKINPRDVVSIPADYNDTKGRCCRYEVVGEYADYYKNNGPLFKSSVYDPETGAQTGFSGLSEEEESFELYGDDEYINSFDSLEDAREYAEDNSSEARVFEIRNEDGEVLEEIEGDRPEFTIFVDGSEVNTAETLEEARRLAVEAYMENTGSEITVEDADGDQVVSMS